MVLDKWKIELQVKKFIIDYSFPPVKGEEYENLVNVFKTCTLRCLINGAQSLSIFQFFSAPPPPPSGAY